MHPKQVARMWRTLFYPKFQGSAESRRDCGGFRYFARAVRGAGMLALVATVIQAAPVSDRVDPDKAVTTLTPEKLARPAAARTEGQPKIALVFSTMGRVLKKVAGTVVTVGEVPFKAVASLREKMTDD